MNKTAEVLVNQHHLNVEKGEVSARLAHDFGALSVDRIRILLNPEFKSKEKSDLGKIGAEVQQEERKEAAAFAPQAEEKAKTEEKKPKSTKRKQNQKPTPPVTPFEIN